jgi:hypothetical protein
MDGVMRTRYFADIKIAFAQTNVETLLTLQIEVPFPAEARDSTLLHSYEVRSTSYSMDIWAYSPRGKAAGVRS